MTVLYPALLPHNCKEFATSLTSCTACLAKRGTSSLQLESSHIATDESQTPEGLRHEENNLKELVRTSDRETICRRFCETSFCSYEMLRPYLHSDCSKRYTRNLICINDEYAVMALVWNAGATSPIHAHEGSGCWVKVVKGELEETRYEVKEGYAGLLRKTRTFRQGEDAGCSYVDDEVGVHCMRNGKVDEVCVSVHLYSPPFAKCDLFEVLEDGRVEVRTSVMRFDTVFGRRVASS